MVPAFQLKLINQSLFFFHFHVETRKIVQTFLQFQGLIYPLKFFLYFSWLISNILLFLIPILPGFELNLLLILAISTVASNQPSLSPIVLCTKEKKNSDSPLVELTLKFDIRNRKKTDFCRVCFKSTHGVLNICS